MSWDVDRFEIIEAIDNEDVDWLESAFSHAYKERDEIASRVASALEYINSYGGIDGGHHKMWVLDQVVRALTGCPMVTRTAKDYKGQEYTYEVQGENEEYKEWVRQHNDGEDGPDTYCWNEGIPP